MSIPNPDHLFDQADRLIAGASGRPRQVDLRRAISSAYYGVFHFTIMSAADEFVGVVHRATPRYALVYRSIGHGSFRDTCLEVTKSAPSKRYKTSIPQHGLGPAIYDFANASADLQQRRHRADYDPQPHFSVSDAKLAVGLARGAIRRFQSAPETERKLFLTLLVCPPRS